MRSAKWLALLAGATTGMLFVGVGGCAAAGFAIWASAVAIGLLSMSFPAT